MSIRKPTTIARTAITLAWLAAGALAVPAQAGVTGSASLSNLQYLLSATESPSLTLVPNTYYGPDGSQSLSVSVTQNEPYARQSSPLDRAATVPLMSGDDANLRVQLDQADASADLQTRGSLTTLKLAGSQFGSGTYSSYASLDQGSWGLSFGPAGQGLLLSPRTTLTISAQAQAQVMAGGDCAANIGFDPQWCDISGADIYLELAYDNPVTGERSFVWDQLKLAAQTSAPGVGAAQQGERNMLISFTNAGDTAMPIAFRYRIQVDGYGYGTSVVPEPATTSLMGLGIVALAWRVRRRVGAGA